jgi:hypothetical protein
MRFTKEQRLQIVEFRMRELEIPSIAELARRGDVDRASLHGFLNSDGGLSPGPRARVAKALGIDAEQFELLYDDEFRLDVVVVPIDLWREVSGTHNVDGDRRERLAKQREATRPEPETSARARSCAGENHAVRPLAPGRCLAVVHARVDHDAAQRRRTVWILGSGSSRALGAPLLGELLSPSTAGVDSRQLYTASTLTARKCACSRAKSSKSDV